MWAWLWDRLWKQWLFASEWILHGLKSLTTWFQHNLWQRMDISNIIFFQETVCYSLSHSQKVFNIQLDEENSFFSRWTMPKAHERQRLRRTKAISRLPGGADLCRWSESTLGCNGSSVGLERATVINDRTMSDSSESHHESPLTLNKSSHQPLAVEELSSWPSCTYMDPREGLAASRDQCHAPDCTL